MPGMIPDTTKEWWCNASATIVILETVTIALCVFGSLSNLSTLLVILFTKLRASVDRILICNLCLAGFLYCSLILSTQTVMFQRREDYLRLFSLGFCSIAGGVRYTLAGTMLVTLAAIALYRLLNGMYFDTYVYMSKRRQLIIMLGLCWVVPMAFAIPPALQLWGAYTFKSSILTCTFNDTVHKNSNRIASVICGFVVPCLFSVYCYIRIGVVSFKRIMKVSIEVGKSKALKLSSMMMCIFLLFFVATFPYMIVNMVDNDYEYPMHHIWSTIFGWGLYCFHPVLLTLMDSRIRNVYKRLIQAEKGNTDQSIRVFPVSRTVIDDTDLVL